MNNKLKEIREAANLSQSELARRSGVLQPKISDYENGKKTFSVQNLSKIAKVLNVDLNELCTP